MGSWTITVRGVGCHHNKGLLTDANRMAADFVQKLRDAGHSVVSAGIAYGSEDNLTDPVVYLDDRDAIEGLPEEQRRPRCTRDASSATPHAAPGLVLCRLAAGHLGDHCPYPTWLSGGDIDQIVEDRAQILARRNTDGSLGDRPKSAVTWGWHDGADRAALDLRVLMRANEIAVESVRGGAE